MAERKYESARRAAGLSKQETRWFQRLAAGDLAASCIEEVTASALGLASGRKWIFSGRPTNLPSDNREGRARVEVERTVVVQGTITALRASSSRRLHGLRVRAPLVSALASKWGCWRHLSPNIRIRDEETRRVRKTRAPHL